MAENFKVVGYYFLRPEDKEIQYDKVDFNILTNVMYSFAIPTPDGHLRPFENEELVKELIDYTHKNSGKISMAVGGWSYKDIPLEATFVQATDTPEKIVQLGDEIVSVCMEYGFDGVDIDWEHPRWESGTYKQYEELITYLSEHLHGKGKLLTSAVLSGVTWDGQIWDDSASHTDKVFEAVDWLNVMTYDGGEGIKHSTYDFAVNCMDYWVKQRGFNKDKIIMGVPFYSYMPPCSYDVILKNDGEAWKKDMAIIDGKEYHYNGVDTIMKKTDYACDNCGGVMFWEVTADTDCKEHSLLQTIGKQISQKHLS